jgi:translation initiation factor IF-2
MEKKRFEQKTQPPTDAGRKLEIVLKCDSAGSVEAVTTAVSRIAVPEGEIAVVRSGIGAVNKSDILLAGTAGKLIVGFQVDTLPDLDKPLVDNGVEVRLYELIYNLVSDLREIAADITAPPAKEQIVGTAEVIALFKGSRGGIIIGCEVREGFLALGQRFRIISAMGPVYAGTVESLHIGENAVQKAVRGQQAGISIRNFKKVRIGDLVESFRAAPRKNRWEPQARIIRVG